VAPIPWRATGAEDALIGQKFTPQLAAKAAEASTIGASPLSQNGYKVDLVRGIVEESLLLMFA
jgi:xanthine dehydrogenase YagS FAD-binding subunit